MQWIHDNVELVVGYQAAESMEIERLVQEFIRPFDLSEAPLLRIKLLKISDDKHILLFDMHHIIADGTSVNILVEELAALYNGRHLPELRLQYKDFTIWQNELFTSEKMKKQEEYWLDVFKGEPPVLAMPTDFPRPVVMNYEGDWHLIELDMELTQGLKNVGVQKDATMFMIFMAGFNLLLSRLTGQEDIIMGATVAGRNHADFEKIIGMFVNTVAFRNSPRKEITFTEFLGEVKDNCLKAFENQDYQFEMLLDKLSIQRNPNRNPLFDIMFNIQNMNRFNLEQISDQLKFDLYQFENKTAKFDLELYFTAIGDKIDVRCNYRTSLFQKSTIEFLMAEFVNVLKQVVQEPDRRLKEYTILSSAKFPVVNQSKVMATLLAQQEQLEQLIQSVATMDNEQVEELLAELLKEKTS